MNHEDNTAQPKTEIPPELEVRIIAWILGEASAFEVAELERLVAEKPEIARFKTEMESVHGLVLEARHPDRNPLRLSTERRARLLQTIGISSVLEKETSKEKPTEPKPIVFPLAVERRKHPNWTRRSSVIAACIAAGFAVQTLYKNRHFSSEQPAFSEERGAGVEAAKGISDYPKSLPAPLPSLPHPSSTINEKSRRQEADRLSEVAGETRRRRSGRAQPAPVAQEFADSEVKLEPFEVKAERGSSYAASSTLAGTRISTDLKDLGSEISVITKQFMLGVGATDTGSLLQYTTNAEVAGTRDNYAGKTEGSAKADESQLFDGDKPAGAFLKKGLARNKESPSDSPASAPTEVVFSENVAAVEKLSALPAPQTWSRGPNSILFGVGSASGTVNTNTVNSPGPGQILDKPLVRPAAKVPAIPDTAETHSSKEPVSTFSLHVSDVSFRLAQAALARGDKPDPASIRPEEFYNAFDYGEPAPAMGDKISCRIEQSAHPTLQQRNLVRIAMKVPATGRGAGQPLRLTVLLDTSGSMEREDRAAAVQQALRVLIFLLGPNDRITLIGFARQPRLIAEQLAGDKAGQLIELLAHTPAEGGTNLEEALKLGTQLAERQFDQNAQNRIVLLTDGAANLGDAVPAHLSALIEALRQKQIAFDACGVGLDGIDDTMLESLTRRGDGRYYVLNTPEAADAGFARQLAGAFRPAAENVKVQVRFNPARVGGYRLLGFDQHRLKEEDFRNDKVDAAELAAEEAAVALYQVEVLPQGEGELGEVYVRFRDASTKEMVERSWTLTYEPRVPAFDRATSTIQLAGVSALLAEKLRGGPAGDAIKLDELAPVVTALRSRFAIQTRVQELVAMYEQTRRLNRD